ncbi:PAS domain-containing hybrid sensor histidine kinase/response regulator [Methylotetracoccus oryzae]|uniref:PAS domain-containing hybrid sensor histidine kinase/response regulator n=1 Tax=Methylotetracoccus oryzae TaxID=1919059 RepID=UPI0013A542AC|nr:PAS domain-containing sensor histidine kinase [Methylotetracoccus oryzae]
MTSNSNSELAVGSSDADIRKLLHDLQVHQIELEMQNAALQETGVRIEADREHYTDLYELAPAGYLTLDCSGAIRQCNLSASRLLGAAREELKKTRLSAFMTGSSLSPFNGFMTRVFESRGEHSITVAVQPLPAVPPIHLHLTALLDTVGETCRVAMIDVSTLKRNEDNYRLMHESLRDGFVRTDLETRILEFNQPFAELLGFTAEELARLTLVELTPDAWRAADDRILREQIFPQGYSEVYETAYRAKDGRVVPVELRTYLSRDVAGRASGLWSSVRDISERKRIEQELTRQAEELRESAWRKDEFLAMLGHELRNPLAPIVSAADVLEGRGVEDPALVRWATAIIKKQSAHLVCLVNELLDVARVSRGKITLSRQVLDLGELLSGVVEDHRSGAEAKGQSLTLAMPPQVVRAEGDAVRLVQIFDNLVHNALKYTPEGGRIELDLRCEGENVVVEVRDSGIGIADTMIPYVFEMFSQAKPVHHRSDGGLGVGLALAKQLIELHGGSIEVFSDGLGRGSRFVVSLPRADLASEPPAMAETETRGLPARRRILIVDDEREIADTLAFLLTEQGHSVRAAYDGEAGLAIVAEAPFDVVILDLRMPRLGGLEVARRLRSQPRLEHLTLIAMTGFGTAADAAASTAAGFDWHLVKPVRLSQLETILDQGVPPRPA